MNSRLPARMTRIASSPSGPNPRSLTARLSTRFVCRLVSRFVEANLGTARQLDGGGEPPPCLLNVRAGDVSGLQRLDGRTQVIAHQVKHCRGHLLSCVTLAGFSLRGVNTKLRRWQRKDQPSTADINGLKLQNIAKETPIGFGVAAVKQEVR